MTNYTIRRLRVEDLRIDSDMTQREMAQELGMHLTTYREYEQQVRRVPADFIVRIAQYFNVSTDYVLGVSPDKGEYRG